MQSEIIRNHKSSLKSKILNGYNQSSYKGRRNVQGVRVSITKKYGVRIFGAENPHQYPICMMTMDRATSYANVACN